MKFPAGCDIPNVLGSLPVRGAWIEIAFSKHSFLPLLSLPVRGAWIEIYPYNGVDAFPAVAPRKGSVD